MCMAVLFAASAQDRTVENRPYTDLRPFHFGVIVGTHVQDVELMNAGPQIIVGEDGTQQETLVTTDQSRWDSGINVGVLGEFRLSQHFQFRVAPTMYFGSRHIVFRDLKTLDANGKPEESRQDMKSAYIACSADIIFAAPRFNNHRPYVMAGITPMMNLSGNTSGFIKLKKSEVFLELGLGCDFYLPYFKLRPELKFMYGITDTFDSNQVKNVRDDSKKPYALAAKAAHSKIIALTFYFE